MLSLDVGGSRTSLRISSLQVCNIQGKSPWELVGPSVLPGQICANRFRFRRQTLTFLQKMSLFSWLLFRKQPSEPFREESIESVVRETHSDRNWCSAGEENVCLIWGFFALQE